MPKGKRTSPWAKKPVEWIEDGNAYLSVVFTWQVEQVRQRAAHLTEDGYAVHVGGPGVFVKTLAREAIKEFATVGGSIPDTVTRHNPQATFASRGCDVGCSFCIVPPMEGRTFTLIPDFTVRPILCDNNLSGLPAHYQDHIVARYRMAEVPLLDANSGFEPRTFDEETFERWKPINRGPWRFALDDQGDLPHAIKVLQMLKDRVPSSKKKRVYVLVGNEPYDYCMERIRQVIKYGAEPHVQYEIKLNAEVKEPWIKDDAYGWTDEKLRGVARWANGFVWKKVPFEQYDKSRRNNPRQTQQE